MQGRIEKFGFILQCTESQSLQSAAFSTTKMMLIRIVIEQCLRDYKHSITGILPKTTPLVVKTSRTAPYREKCFQRTTDPRKTRLTSSSVISTSTSSSAEKSKNGHCLGGEHIRFKPSRTRWIYFFGH